MRYPGYKRVRGVEEIHYRLRTGLAHFENLYKLRIRLAPAKTVPRPQIMKLLKQEIEKYNN